MLALQENYETDEIYDTPELTPIQKMMWAMLESALSDLRSSNFADRRTAYSWILDTHHRDYYSFIGLCDELGVSELSVSKFLRAAIASKHERIAL